MRKRGALIVEFALVLPFMLYLIFNMIFGLIMLYDRHNLGEYTYEYVREIAVNATDSVVVDPDGVGGAGLALGKADEYKFKLCNKLNSKLIIYELPIENDVSSSIVLGIRSHETDKNMVTHETADYKRIVIHDADVYIKATAQLKSGIVPIIAMGICPEKLAVERQSRIEMRINSVVTAKK